MTNYRLTMCAYHHLPEFKFCFTCGAPLEQTVSSTYATTGEWRCSRDPYHVAIFAEDRKHGDPDNDYCEGVQVE